MTNLTKLTKAELIERIADLEADLDAATDSHPEMDDNAVEMLAAMQEALAEVEDERDALKARLDALTPGADELGDLQMQVERAIQAMYRVYGSTGADGEKRRLPYGFAATYIDALVNASHEQIYGFEYGNGKKWDSMEKKITDAVAYRMRLEETPRFEDDPKHEKATLREAVMIDTARCARAVHDRLLEIWQSTQDNPHAVWISRKERQAERLANEEHDKEQKKARASYVQEALATGTKNFSY